MTRGAVFFAALFGTGAAVAQDGGLSVSIGARAWYAGWTTFSYFTQPENGVEVNKALSQVSSDDKLVLVPTLALRYGDFLAAFSALPATQLSFGDNQSATRREFDVNLGYAVLPGLTATLGYKSVSQSGNAGSFRRKGPVVGLNAGAPLAGPWSLYGTLAAGRLKTPGGDQIQFDSDYRLTELGLAYTLSQEGWPKRWTFTAGYRIQLIGAKEAFTANGRSQDGRDTTQGFTLGVLAGF